MTTENWYLLIDTRDNRRVKWKPMSLAKSTADALNYAYALNHSPLKYQITNTPSNYYVPDIKN